MINELSYLIINQLVNFDHDHTLVRVINDIVNNSSESDDDASADSSRQLLVY